MIKVSAYYYDGVSAAQKTVEVTFSPGGAAWVSGDGVHFSTSLDQLQIESRMGNTPRNIVLKQGGKLEIADNDAIDQVCAHFYRRQHHSWLYRLEKSYPYALIAAIIAIAFIWGAIEWGVPRLAKVAANAIPLKAEENIALEGLKTLDDWVFEKSELDLQQQRHLQKLLQQIESNLNSNYHYQLKLRSSREVGANALALPGGLIIMTDALFHLAENDQQIIAVLAHEIGHIEHQHGLRAIFQSSVSALLMAGLLGDVGSISSLSVTLPTVLLESRYSRAFELEADDFASAYLTSNNIKPERLIEILTLLSSQQSTNSDFDYLSSHPAMEKRIREIEKP